MLSSKNLLKHKRLEGNKSEIQNKSKKGFSLLEIVVSLGLIALFIIPAGNMVMGTVKINKAAEDKQQANAVLQETVEYIKGLEEFPDIGNSITLSNGVIVTRTEDKINPNEVFLEEESAVARMHYEVKKVDATEYGFTVNGEMYGEKILTEINYVENVEEDEAGKANIDGTVYYRGKDVWVTEGPTTINSVINNWPTGPADLHIKNKLEITNNGEGNIRFEADKKKVQISRNVGAILMVLDGYTLPFNFNVDINGNKDLIIYLYDKMGKLSSSDIINNAAGVTIKFVNGSGTPGGGTGNTNGTVNVSGSTTNLYNIDIKATKDSKIVDNINMDFIN